MQQDNNLNNLTIYSIYIKFTHKFYSGKWEFSTNMYFGGEHVARSEREPMENRANLTRQLQQLCVVKQQRTATAGWAWFLGGK